MSGRRLVSGVVGLVIAGGLAAALLYVSRFWTWRFWGNDGLFGQQALGPGGDQLRRGLGQGAGALGVWELNAFDVLVWALAIFVVLSLIQWLWDKAATAFGAGGH